MSGEALGVDFTPAEHAQITEMAAKLGCAPSEVVRLALRVLHGGTFVDLNHLHRLERVPLADLEHIQVHRHHTDEYMTGLQEAFRTDERQSILGPPPIRLVRVNRRGRLRLLNGNHRLAAARAAGCKTIDAFVLHGDWLLDDGVKKLVLECGFEVAPADTFDLAPDPGFEP
jgi:hypothetical protein